MFIFPQSGADASIYLVLRDSAGAPVTGLLYNSAGAKAYYVRPRGTPVAITLATLANAQSAHADGGFVEVDATNMPGLYRLDLPDAAIDDGENYVLVQVDFTATLPTATLVLLDPHPSIIQGKVVADAGNTSSTFKTNLTEGSTDAFKSAFLLWRTGITAGEVQKVTAFDPATDYITVSPAFSEPPATDDEFVIINR